MKEILRRSGLAAPIPPSVVSSYLFVIASRRRIGTSGPLRRRTPVVGWHNFRYTYSTWADPTRESIKALQNQLGHTDSPLTLSVYTQPIPEPPEAQRQLANKIARVLLPVACR